MPEAGTPSTLSSPPGAAFCQYCGSGTVERMPDGDNRLRRVCTGCEHIHYDNPKNVVGCLLEWEGKILLCKRAIEPRYGFWTLPAGFMENGETTPMGAAREAKEEACAECEDLRLLAIFSLPRISQVYMMYYGTLKDGFAEASEETLEVQLCDEADIPWGELAFPVVTETLERYFKMRAEGDIQVFSGDIHSRPGATLEIVRHS